MVTAGWDWESGEGLLGVDDPAEWDAAHERGAPHLGTAVIGLAFNCPLAEASPRILRAMRLPDRGQRGFAFTAAGTAARINGELTPELYAALRAEGHRGLAETAVDDTLDHVPFRQLPLWFKWRKVASKVQDKLKTWWSEASYAIEDARKAHRR
ncbi:hypothetical protein OG302_12735 [Streptomyces sp. NBC_01283]|uniref:hypothetical protein n=1 Tax=Streptomyces sp. NBC_01283 TaxID=2903812 RepID=UPI00352EB7BA|nr:hypothetical protein OG302_12735 [Streptomyces sp. NBC_01283]